MERDPAEAEPTAADQLAAVRLEFEAQSRKFEEVKERLQQTVDRIAGSRPQEEMLRNSAFARLQARLASMPVIEQAKGIVMAQQRCGPDEAFDLLRRMSQRVNVKVSVLAAQMVEQVASDAPGSQAASGAAGNAVTPSGPAANGQRHGPRSALAQRRHHPARGPGSESR